MACPVCSKNIRREHWRVDMTPDQKEHSYIHVCTEPCARALIVWDRLRRQRGRERAAGKEAEAL